MSAGFAFARWDQAFNEWVKQDYDSLTSLPPPLCPKPTDGAEGWMSIHSVMYKNPEKHEAIDSMEEHLDAFNSFNSRLIHLPNVFTNIPM